MNTNEMAGLDIINIKDYGDALRNSGYKDIESAMAEIVDNSLQAEASKILVIIKDRVPSWGKKNQVYEVAFLDNGIGMSPAWVQGCLRFGNGTRRSEKGIGKFGVGLPQSSLYACPRVEVYSWQDGIENCYYSYLDITEVSSGTQTKINPAERIEIPSTYKKYFVRNLKLLEDDFDFSKSGTLVIWKRCDNVVPSTAAALFRRLGESFGRKYRYLIGQEKSNIYLVHDTKDQYNEKVLPNDPLFLMENNLVLGDPNDVERLQKKQYATGSEPLFEPYITPMCPTGNHEILVKYFDRYSKLCKEGKVNVKFSVVKEKFYDKEHMTCANPGQTPMGKFVGGLEGISIVREGREIDFGDFGFYSDKNNPFHRWWGCEISFNRDLDEVFKVSNNKQHVELIKLDGADYDEEEYKPVWLQLENVLVSQIGNMVRRNKELRKGTRTGTNVVTPAEETATKAESGQNVDTESEQIREKMSSEDLVANAEEILVKRGNQYPTDEDIQKIMLLEVVINEEPLGEFTEDLFRFSVDTGFCICRINTDSIYYDEYVRPMDDEAQNAFKLLIASFVRTINESAPEKRSLYKDIMHDWNHKLNKYIRTFLGMD